MPWTRLEARPPRKGAPLGRGLRAAGLGAALAAGLGSAAVAADRAETLRVVTGGSINTLDASTTGVTRDAFGLNWNIYDRLVTWERKPVEGSGGYVYDFESMRGELAESWEVSEDGKTITFAIKPDAVFHDGTPVEAEDVRWSLERAVTLPGPKGQMAAGSMTDPSQFEVVDDKTFRLTLPRADRLATPDLAVVYPVIYNKDLVVSEAGEDDPWGVEWLKSNQASSGAYKVERFTPGQNVVLSRNEDWVGGPMPAFKQVIVQTVPEAATRASLVERGDADISIDLQPDDVQAIAERGSAKVVSIPQVNVFQMVAFNNQMAPFDDKDVRKAVAYALPYDAMFQTALRGQGAPLWGGEWEETPDSAVFPQPLPFEKDLDKARAHLEAAGMPDGFETTFSINVGSAAISEPMAALIQESLGEIGIEVTIEKLPDAQMGTRLAEKNVAFFTESANAWLPSTDYFFRTFFQKDWRWNFGSYDSEELAELTSQARFETDEAEYDRLAKEMIALAAEDVPVVLTWQPAMKAVMGEDIGGFTYWFHRQLDYRNLTRE